MTTRSAGTERKSSRIERSRTRSGRGSVTELLHRYNRGDRRAMDGVVRRIGPDLHRLARHYLKRERRNHTLDSRALVHEAYMRLAGQQRVVWRNRQHFLGVAAQTMRRILCDYARKRNSLKRGGDMDRRPVSLSEIDADAVLQDTFDQDLPLGINLALERLSQRDPVAAELVELRYFGDFTLAEISEMLDIPARTLSRRWRFARAWLYKELNT